MLIQAIAFYVFAAIAVAAAVMVVSSRNPVHSVLFLILTFVSSACLFVLLGAEFVAMILIVVYVGAVAVLFLFVVMMLDINFAELKRGLLHYVPIGLAVGLVVLGELLAVTGGWITAPETVAVAAAPTPDIAQLSNTKALGLLIYTKYVYLFQAAGMILLVAMIGAIVLTLRHRDGVRRQNSSRQFGRTREASIAVVKVKSGQGLPSGEAGA
jgi:NADH-quinone oxidoreductase subunit J